jgi:hypothetical protein
MTYNELKEALRDAPMTWCPALLQTLVETAIAKGCFVPGGATRFVDGIERKQPVPPVKQVRVRGNLQHGVNCRKVLHITSGMQGWMHESDDDKPYDVDGVNYCGRCHQAL